MVISESSLYSFIFGLMLAKGRGIPLKVWFLPDLVGKEDKQIVHHADIQQGNETLPSNTVASKVLIIKREWAVWLGSRVEVGDGVGG